MAMPKTKAATAVVVLKRCMLECWSCEEIRVSEEVKSVEVGPLHLKISPSLLYAAILGIQDRNYRDIPYVDDRVGIFAGIFTGGGGRKRHTVQSYDYSG